MLFLSCYRDKSIIIGDDIVVTVVDIRDDKVRLEINTPLAIPVYRQEVYEAIQRENESVLALVKQDQSQASTESEQTPPTPILMKGVTDASADKEEK